MRQTFIILFFVIVSFVLHGQTKKDTTDETEKAAVNLVDEEYLEVSLIKLIATPEKYNGKRIQVIGYLHLEFEGNAIYLHKEDEEAGLSKNGFWVNFF